MQFDDLLDGLKKRGFQNTESICSKGHCHFDEKHFILLTDGLVIYSNFWDWNSCGEESEFGNVRGGLYEIWCMELSEYDPKTKEFSFEELDQIMS
jgi:hypothetical protein